MLNEDFFDEKDRKIARLEQTIEHFKKYDSERKKYYSKALIELGQLKEYVAELEDTDKKARKLKQQRIAIRTLEKIISDNKYLAISDAEKIGQINVLKIQEENIKLLERMKVLSKDLTRARENISRLCSKLSKYEQYEAN